MTAPEIPRRRLIRTTAAAGIGGLFVPGAVSVGSVLASTRTSDSPVWGDDARPTVLDSRGTWGVLGVYFAQQFGDFGRATWYDADWSRVIAARRQSGELPESYTPHPSSWYAAVHDRSWIGDRLIGVNPDSRRYVVADIIDVVSSPNAVVDWSSAAFAELGVPLSRGVQSVWIVRVPA